MVMVIYQVKRLLDYGDIPGQMSLALWWHAIAMVSWIMVTCQVKDFLGYGDIQGQGSLGLW